MVGKGEISIKCASIDGRGPDFFKKFLFFYQQGFRGITSLGNSLKFASSAQVEALAGGLILTEKSEMKKNDG